MRELWSTKNTYTVSQDGEVVGWIRFVKWESRPGWFIEEDSRAYRLPWLILMLKVPGQN